MTTRDVTSVSHRLRNIVALLLVVAVVALGAVLIRAFGPSSAVLDQRAADRAAWEKSQTAEQRAATEAWRDAVRDSQRQRGLIALVFLVGNIIIVVTCIRSTRANARETGTGTIRPGGAFVRVMIQGTIAFGVACAIMIVVPVIESIVADGHGMYSGEQMLSAIFTIISFLFFLTLSLGLACAVLWRRNRAHP